MKNTDELFEVIYDRYMPLLRLVAIRKSIPYDEINDIVQDAFISFYTHYPVTWPDYRIRSTLMRITHNLCADYFRDQNLHPVTYFDFSDFDNIEMSGKLLTEHDPLETIMEHQKYKDILTILKSMKTEWRIVLLLYTIQERPMNEISKMLGISEAACRKRLRLGKQYLYKENEKKHGGMTLVEVIAVMATVSVLSATVTPSVFGFIDKVTVQQYVMEANSVRISAQMFVTEEYAAGTLDDIKTMSKLVEGRLDSEKHTLTPYLMITCSPGARLTGATIQADEGELVEIVYQVDDYTITVNENGTSVEETTDTGKSA